MNNVFVLFNQSYPVIFTNVGNFLQTDLLLTLVGYMIMSPQPLLKGWGFVGGGGHIVFGMVDDT